MDSHRLFEDIDEGLSLQMLLHRLLQETAPTQGLALLSRHLHPGCEAPSTRASDLCINATHNVLSNRESLEGVEAWTTEQATTRARKAHESNLTEYRRNLPVFRRRLAFMDDLIRHLVGWQFSEADPDLLLKLEVIKAQLLVKAAEARSWLLAYRNPGPEPVQQTGEEFKARILAFSASQLAGSEERAVKSQNEAEEQLPLLLALRAALETMWAGMSEPA